MVGGLANGVAVLARWAACPLMTLRPSAPFAPTCTAASLAALTPCSSWSMPCWRPSPVASLPHLSLQAAHRRGWGSLYDALAAGPHRRRGAPRVAGAAPGHRRPAGLRRRPERLAALRRRGQPRARASTTIRPATRPASRSWPAGPTSGWPNSASRAIAGPRRSTCGASIRRENANAVAVEQITALVGQPPATAATPAVRLRRRLRLGAADAGLGRRSRSPSWSACAPTAASMPTRRRRYPRRRAVARASTAPSSPARTRRPGPHRPPSTWPRTSSTARCACAPGPGCIPSSRPTPGAAPARPRPIVRGTVVLVEVSRLPARPYPAAGALAVVGRTGHAGPRPALARLRPPLRPGAHAALLQAEPGLDDAPRPPPRASRPLDLAGRGRLHPAAPGRPWVADRRLPWERPLDPDKLTPSRVRRALSALLPMVGTPASAPKPCGRSPGRPKGQPLGARHPLPGPEEGRLRRACCPDLTPIRRVSRARRDSCCG